MNTSNRWIALVVAFAAVAGATKARSADYTWTGGSGAAWNTTSTNWSGGGSDYWTSATGTANRAFFNTAGASATVSGTVFANGLSLLNTATISSGTISLGGPTPTIDILNSASGSLLSTPLAGSGGVRFTNSSPSPNTTLVLGAVASPITGGVTIDNGVTLRAGVANQFGNLANAITVNGGLNLNSFDLRFTRFSGSGTISGPGMVRINSGTSAFSGVMSGASRVVWEAGGATLNFTGDNQTSGQWVFRNGGTLILGSTDALKTTSSMKIETDSTTTLVLAAGDLRANTTNMFLNNGSLLSVRFAASGADRNLIWTGASTGTAAPAATLTWGSIGTGQAVGSGMGFGGPLATHTLNWVSGINLSGTAGAVRQFDAINGAATVAGDIQGSISDSGTAMAVFQKTGAGTLALSGSNSFGGQVQVSDGVLRLANANALAGGGAITFAGGTLQYTASNTVDYSARITSSTGAIAIDTNGQTAVFASTLAASNTGGLRKAGAGALRLTGLPSYSGTTTIAAGTLDFGFASGTTTWSSPIVGSSGTFRWSGAGALVVNSTANDLNSFSGPVVVDSGLLQMGVADSSQRRGFVSATSFTVNSGATLAFTRDSMALVPVTLNSGTLTTGTIGGLGGAFQQLGSISMNAGTIVTGNGLGAGLNPFVLNGDVAVAGSGVSQILAGGNSENGMHLAFNAASGVSRTFTVSDATGDATPDLAVSARLLNSSHSGNAVNLVKAGVGTMRLSGSNGYTGSTTVSAGTLDFTTANALRNTSGVSVAAGGALVYSGATSGTLSPSISGAGSFRQTGAGTLSLAGSNGFTGATSLDAGTLALASSGALSATGTISFGGGTLQYSAANQADFSAIIRSSTGAIAIDTSGQTVVFASTLDASNTGGLRKAGAGTLRLTNSAPGIAGPTTINAGTLELAAASGTATLAGSLVGSGGIFARTGGGTTIISGTGNSFAGALSVTAGLVQIGTATTSNVGSQALGSLSSVTVGPGAALVLRNSTAINLAAPIALSGTLSTDVAGVVGGGFTNYLGPLTMSGGSLIANSGANASSFQSYALTAGVTVTGSAASTISAAPGAVGGGIHLTHVAGGLRTFDVADVTASAAADLIVSAALVNATSTGSASGLAKTGLGTMLISSTSTYSGATQVAAGTLVVNGRLANTSGVTVDAGATLGGAGVIAALATVNGTLAPGNSPGEITLASLALGSTATTLIEVAGTARGSQYDGITITQAGGLTYGGTLSFDFASLLGDDTTLDIFSFTGSSAGGFSSVVSTGSYAGSWTNNNDGTHSLQQGSQTLTFSQLSGDVIIVPEPGVLALAGAGLAVGVLRAWSRRRSRG